MRNTGVLTDTVFFQLDEEIRATRPGHPDIQLHFAATLVENSGDTLKRFFNVKDEVYFCY